MKAVSKDKRFAVPVESLRQRADYLPFAEVLAFFNKVALDNAPATMNVMAFTAMPVAEARQQMPVEEEDARQAARKRSDKLKPCFAEQKGRCHQMSFGSRFSHDPTILKNAPPPPELGQRSLRRGSRGDSDGVCSGCSKLGHGVQQYPVYKLVPHATQSAPIARLASAAAPVEVGTEINLQDMIGNMEPHTS
jgi:hypothetical protein